MQSCCYFTAREGHLEVSLFSIEDNNNDVDVLDNNDDNDNYYHRIVFF